MLQSGQSNQDLLENAVGYTSLGKQQQRDELLSQIRHECRQDGIDKALEHNQLDVIMGPADSAFNLLVCGGGELSHLSSASVINTEICIGYPSATMPSSYLSYNGRPIGVFAIARRHDEKTFLQVMKAWERTFPPRKVPDRM